MGKTEFSFTAKNVKKLCLIGKKLHGRVIRATRVGAEGQESESGTESGLVQSTTRKLFLNYETEFVLFLAVLEIFVLPMG